jgi:hypothetical protein
MGDKVLAGKVQLKVRVRVKNVQAQIKILNFIDTSPSNW